MNIPSLSQPFFGAIDLTKAALIADVAFAEFAGNDHTHNRNDPSCCAWIARLPSSEGCAAMAGTGWIAKGSIDADGPAAGDGFSTGKEMDPDSGQNTTSLKFANGDSLPSEGCPYAVLPGGDFSAQTGLSLGDVCVIIFEDKITAAVFGDIGPGTGPGHNNPKIGEYSIRVHNRLRPRAPDPCSHRDDVGKCLRVLNSSISGGVICIGFPGSAISNLALETCQEQIEERAFGLWAAIGGVLK